MASVTFIVLNALACFAATRLVRALAPGVRGVERVLLAVVSVPVLVVPTLIALGALGWLRPWPAAAALAAWSVGLELARRRRGRLRSAPQTPAQDSLPSAAYTLALGAAWGLVALLGFDVFEQQCLRGWMPQWDDLSYHAPMAAHWLRAERLVLAPFNYHAHYPGTGELFAAWFMLASRHDAFASLSGLYWMTTAALAVATLTRRLGGGALSALVAVAMLLSCSAFLPQAASFAAVDLGGAALIAAALAVALGVNPTQSLTALRGRAVYVGCLSGLAIGMKITFAPVAVLLVAWMLWERRCGLREALEVVALSAACALCLGGYWYLRNYVITGNPLFPAKVWTFDGPLDAITLRPTALLFHLLRLEGPELTAAFWKLLDWPGALACLFLGAYAMAGLTLLRPGFWRARIDRSIVLCWAAGMLALITAVAGPFSGAPNEYTPVLNVRLRFYLLVALIGIPLFAGYLGRTRAAQPWLAFVTLALLAVVSPHAPLELGLALASGAVAGAALGRREGLLTAPRHTLVIASCLALPLLASVVMVGKQAENETVRAQLSAAWSGVAQLPRGSRLTWFGSGESHKYYLAFGADLSREPVAVRGNGQPFMHLHEHWRENAGTSWNAAARTKGVAGLLENLQAQRIEYVLLMRKSSLGWPVHLEQLVRSPEVSVVKQRNTFALVRIAPPVGTVRKPARRD